MIVCDCFASCVDCNWRTADKLSDVVDEFRDCFHLEEVEPVRHGKWKLHKDGSATCNQCHMWQFAIWDYDNWQNYCGCCGAKMDAEVHS